MVRLLRDNMIENAMKDCIRERRNLCVKAISAHRMGNGVVEDVSHVQMLWAVISVLKQAGYVCFISRRLHLEKWMYHLRNPLLCMRAASLRAVG